MQDVCKLKYDHTIKTYKHMTQRTYKDDTAELCQFIEIMGVLVFVAGWTFMTRI